MSNIKSRVFKDGGIRQMVAISLPMVAAQACDTMMIFTDRLFLAKLDSQIMNAALGGGLTAFMMMSFFIGLTGYTTALVGQYLGAGKKENCAKVVTQALFVSLAAYPFILAGKPLALGLFEFIGVGEGQIGPQRIYFSILLNAVIFALIRTVMSGFFSGIGRTRIVLLASGTAMVFNIIMNYVLIFGKLGFPVMGIRGAAYGTIIGSMSGMMVLVLAYLSKKTREEFGVAKSWRFDWQLTSKLLRFGSPAGGEMFLNILAFNSMIMLFHSHSPVTATATTVFFNWDLVAFVPLLGLEIGVTSLVARFMGASRPDIAHSAVMSGLKMGFVYSSLILVLFVGFPDLLVNVFRPAGGIDGLFTQSVPMAVFMIRMASLYVLVEAMLMVFIGALRGAGDTYWAMGASVALHWTMVGVLLVILRVLKLSPEVGWTVVVMLFLLFSAMVYWRYHGGQWKKIQIIGE